MRRLLGCAVTVVAVFPCACVRIPDRLPEDMPDELVFVIAHEERFAQQDDGPLARVTPGTVVADLNGLEGCWGVAHDPGPLPGLLASYQAITFDRERGEITRWNLVDFAGVTTSLIREQGTFSIEGNARIVGTLRSLEYFPDSGQFEEITSGVPFDWNATLAGDCVKIRFGGPINAHLTYVRFDCPE